MINDRVLSMIGLATKAGKTVTGEFMSEKAVKEGKACLVIVASDASDNTKKKFINMCSYYQVTIREYANKVLLGNACGKEFRATLAILDKGFADSILKKMISYDNLEVQ